MSRLGSDRASVMMLVPAGVLVVMILGAIAVDAAVVFLAEREAAAAAAAAANDAATVAIDEGWFRETGEVVLDGAKAIEVAHQAVAARAAHLALDVEVDVVAADRVRVTVRGTAHRIFAGVVPGADTSAPVEAAATATAVRR